MEPKPVASMTNVSPGDVFTTAVLAETGASRPPWAENIPRSEATTLIRKGALVWLPSLTVILTDGTPAGISNGTWTFTCVGLM
jgi:hypothetical protein